MSNVISDPNFPVQVPGDALARSIRFRKPVINQDTTLTRRQGVVTAVNLVNGIPYTVDLVLGDADVTVPGVQFLSSCMPEVGTCVWVDMKGADPLVVGQMTPNPWQVVSATAGAATFLNGWVNYGGGYHWAAYRREPFNVVRIRGLVANGTIGQAIFTLPLGYRPTGTLLFGTEAFGGHARFDIQTNGNVQATSGQNPYYGINCEFTLDP